MLIEFVEVAARGSRERTATANVTAAMLDRSKGLVCMSVNLFEAGQIRR